VAQAYRAAGLWIEPFLEANRNTIESLARGFTVSCLLLTLVVVLRTISVTG
jgi:hypothetical protein